MNFKRSCNNTLEIFLTNIFQSENTDLRFVLTAIPWGSAFAGEFDAYLDSMVSEMESSISGLRQPSYDEELSRDIALPSSDNLQSNSKLSLWSQFSAEINALDQVSDHLENYFSDVQLEAENDDVEIDRICLDDKFKQFCILNGERQRIKFIKSLKKFISYNNKCA